ncbi:hypothetical protein [Brachyspira alvinipulli]|uniref:hypothetical protein n=1 Tax=Brachyspira alvinipulli TaxID=84379 RepID=UPI0004817EB9|nr:hypothetical protein [Brachyspira alvinipulli]
MKKIRIFAVLICALLFSKFSFAESGWQFGVMIPIGASFSFYNVNFSSQATSDYMNNYKKSTGTIGFDIGVNLQGGYLVSDGDIGISLLADLGYSHDSFGLTSSYQNTAGKKVDVKEYYTFENLSVGILPKFHYKNFGIGLGLGVKIPLYLTHSTESKIDNTSTKTYGYYNASKIDDVIKNSVITYVKLTFDYSFYVADDIALLLGAYLGTDFGLDLRGAEVVMVESRDLASFDLGVQLGVKFGQGIFD